MLWSSKQGYSPIIPIVLLIMAVGFLVEGKADLSLYAGMILLGTDLVRYFVLSRWEGQKDSVAEASDERALAIARYAGQQAFWLVSLSMWLWLGAGRNLDVDPRQGVFWIFVLGLIAYVLIELKERRKVH